MNHKESSEDRRENYADPDIQSLILGLIPPGDLGKKNIFFIYGENLNALSNFKLKNDVTGTLYSVEIIDFDFYGKWIKFVISEIFNSSIELFLVFESKSNEQSRY